MAAMGGFGGLPGRRQTPEDARGWRRWSTERLTAWVEANEYRQDEWIPDLITDMERELDERDMIGTMEDPYPHDEHIGLDLPGGYTS